MQNVFKNKSKNMVRELHKNLRKKRNFSITRASLAPKFTLKFAVLSKGESNLYKWNGTFYDFFSDICSFVQEDNYNFR